MASMLGRTALCLRSAALARQATRLPCAAYSSSGGGHKPVPPPFLAQWFDEPLADKEIKKAWSGQPASSSSVVPRAPTGYVDHGLEVAGAGVGLLEHEVCEATMSTYNHALSPTEDWKTGYDNYNSFANKLLAGAIAFAVAGLATLAATGYFSLPYSFKDYKSVKIDPRGTGAELSEEQIPFSGIAAIADVKAALAEEPDLPAAVIPIVKSVLDLLGQGLDKDEIRAKLLDNTVAAVAAAVEADEELEVTAGMIEGLAGPISVAVRLLTPGAGVKADVVADLTAKLVEAELFKPVELTEEEKDARILALASADLSEEDFIAKAKAEGLLEIVIAQAEAKGNHELAEDLRRQLDDE